MFQVLQLYELKEPDIAGAVTDAGAGVTAGLGQACKWEWCMLNILNRVAVDGTGTALDKTRSKNPLARQLVDDSRRVIKHFNKSDASKIGLVGVQGMVVMHCWTNART